MFRRRLPDQAGEPAFIQIRFAAFNFTDQLTDQVLDLQVQINGGRSGTTPAAGT